MKINSLFFKALEYYGLKIPHRGKWWVHAKIRKLFKTNVDIDLEVTRNDLRWLLNPSDHVQSDLYWFGVKDYWEIYHIKQLLKPGNIIFDIGANFGFYSIVLCDALDSKCSVHAFEPIPSTYKRLLEYTASEKGSGMNWQLITYKSILPVQTNPTTYLYLKGRNESAYYVLRFFTGANREVSLDEQ